MAGQKRVPSKKGSIRKWVFSGRVHKVSLCPFEYHKNKHELQAKPMLLVSLPIVNTIDNDIGHLDGLWPLMAITDRAK